MSRWVRFESFAPMKVNNTSGTGSATGAGKARATGGGQGFQLPTVGGASAPAAAASVSSLSPVMNVSALLALQDVGTPTERKRKAVRRAARMLDALESRPSTVSPSFSRRSRIRGRGQRTPSWRKSSTRSRRERLLSWPNSNTPIPSTKRGLDARSVAAAARFAISPPQV